MARKKARSPLNYPQIMRKLNHAGLAGNETINRLPNGYDDIPDLRDRVGKIMGLVNDTQRPATNMLFFVMYDIESNKVRYQIAKYLLRMGCFRVQRSIFMADLPSDKYDKIRGDLATVQSLYDNHDSILIVPISIDYLKAMRVIGKSINIDVIMKNVNTLFF